MRFECDKCGTEIEMPVEQVRHLLQEAQGHTEVIKCKCDRTLEIINGDRETREFKTRWVKINRSY